MSESFVSVAESPPVVNGIPTTLHTLTREELHQWSLLEPLVNTINAAFASTHAPHIFPLHCPRFRSAMQLPEELDPSAVTYVLTQGHGPNSKIIGAASEEASTCTIRFLAVDPSVQRQGIAGWLLRLAEGYAARRERRQSLRMLLDTVKEVNEGFYARRGWRVVRDEVVAPGSGDSPSGYTTVYMDKIVDAAA